MSTDALVAETSLGLKRVSWLSWWAQVILTTISAVILIFARNVAGGGARDVQLNFVLPGTGANENYYLQSAAKYCGDREVEAIVGMKI